MIVPGFVTTDPRFLEVRVIVRNYYYYYVCVALCLF